jgi:mannose-1-phosphate guanylyltransferase
MNAFVRFPVGMPGSVLGVVLAGGEGKRLWPLTLPSPPSRSAEITG